mgnify:CR=1 FL=1
MLSCTIETDVLADHLPVAGFINFDQLSDINKQNKLQKISITKLDRSMLAEKFAEPQCWASVLESNEPESTFELFTEVVQQQISDSFKTKIIKASNKTVFKKLWMSHKILQLRNERQRNFENY